MYEGREGCSDCIGEKSTVAFTNTRIISRVQQPCPLFCCCAQGSYDDKTILFKNISVLQKKRRARCAFCVQLLYSCLTCQCLCFLCGVCCCNKLRSLEVKGEFGSEELIFHKKEYLEATNNILTKIMPSNVKQDEQFY